MKAIIKLFGMFLFVLATSAAFASDDDCNNCEDTNTCPPPPPGESMSLELGE